MAVEDPHDWNKTIQILFEFFSNNFWRITLLVTIIAARRQLGGFIDRLIKAKFSYGNASGSLEAAAPVDVLDQQKSDVDPKKSESSAEDDEGTEKGDEGDDEDMPWFMKMHNAFNEGKVEKAKQDFEAYVRNEPDDDARHNSEAVFLHYLYSDGGEEAALDKQRELLIRSDSDTKIQTAAYWLSSTYKKMRDFKNAESALLAAKKRVTNSEANTAITTYLAQMYREDGKPESGRDVLEARLAEVDNPGEQATIYSALATLEKGLGNDQKAAIALEKVVELRPGDKDKLFDAAYTASNGDLNLLAIINYETLLNLDPDNATAINNLGVCAGEFELNGKQVSYYRRSTNLGSTLAMSNLANALVTNGYWDEAKKILDEARTSEDPHQNVSSSLVTLNKLEKKEADEWRKIRTEGIDFQKEMRRYGEAVFDSCSSTSDFEGIWQAARSGSPDVESTVISGIVQLSWTETTKGALSATETVFAYSMSGAKRNRSATLTYKKKQISPKSVGILSGIGQKDIDCYSYLSADKARWIIFSRNPRDDFTLTLTRESAE